VSVRFASGLEDYNGGPDDPAPLVVHPRFRFAPAGEVPQALLPRLRFRDRFAGPAPMAWIDDPATSVLLPVWLRDDEADVLARFEAGKGPRGVAPELRRKLTAASILTTPDALERRTRASRARIRRATARFGAARYAALEPFLPAAFVGRLAAYCHDVTAGVPLGDEQCAGRHALHNEPMARFLQHQLTPVVSAVAGERLRPSYAYSVVYREGATLARHVDREQCEVSVTLLLDYRPGAAAPGAWPLWLGTKEGAVRIRQRAGSVLVYRGRELPHWREPLAAGSRSASLLLHYVPRDFRGALD
jgi:hypothetical protein